MTDTKLSNPKDLLGMQKAPMSTVPARVMAEVGVAMFEGAAKYGRYNFRAVGVRASVYYDATMRHLMDWWEGQDIDPDSGMSHITKAITSLVVLRDSMIQGNWSDDRPPHSPEFYAELNQKVAALREKYSDRDPTHYTQTLMSKQFGQQNTIDYRPDIKPFWPQSVTDPRTVAGVDVSFETEKHMNFAPACQHLYADSGSHQMGSLGQPLTIFRCDHCGDQFVEAEHA
ncbi:dATP/dGTP diphosphohydrolase domain-containing protein [Stutzerimonas stutzeri]|uniref:dATP/dGTP diphosphohydrolase N-terminal domain-containing protein n=1 Tax=Stutzerimonas stutzeri TaxID=316 RepID=A0A172WRN8_STUST|nr:dATP/dGTP diphosphohydrolase domain-containing protein [Stutzerimonas stutzeri]ANF26016.1 hypothetical protein PS273GM_13120 [Stutzerimonas stutzeri]